MAEPKTQQLVQQPLTSGAAAYKGLPEAYRRWRASGLGQITDRLEEHLILEMAEPVDGLSVLDVGCGDGALAVAMARGRALVTALDADPQMLAAARERADGVSVPLQLVEGRAEALPFGDAAFDLVVAVTVLCFVQQVERAVQEMARVLRPRGRLVIGELGSRNLWATKRRVSGWLGSRTWRSTTFHTREELRRLVASGGFSIDQVSGAIYYPPCGVCAGLVAPVDPWLGRQTTAGAAFLAIAAMKSDRPIIEHEGSA